MVAKPRSGILLQLVEDQFRIGLERIEDSKSRRRYRFEPGRAKAMVQLVLKVFQRDHIGQIPFVVLHDEGNLENVIALLGQVLLEILNALDVGFHTLDLGIGHKDNTIDTFEDQFAGCIVKDLSWNGIEVKTCLETADSSEFERQKIEKKRSIRLRGQGDHLALGFRIGPVIDTLQVCGLATQTRTVVYDLAIYLSR